MTCKEVCRSAATNHSRWFALLLIGLLTFLRPVSADEVIELSTRPEVIQQFLLIEHPDPIVNVILFPGGKGKLKLNEDWLRRRGNNFLVRTRKDLAALGFTVALLNAPSDRQGVQGMFGGFRNSKEHAQDIDGVVSYLKELNKAAVWLVGTSRGTESAANGAIRLEGKINGLVLTASVTEPNNKGVELPRMDLARITVPTLIISHEDDKCRVTPPEGAEKIKAGLTRAPEVVIKYFAGGKDPSSEPCKGLSSHGFYGIEREVINEIAAFITRNSK